ncbi:MAG: hypothetical protein LBF04_02630 [Prevotellaceae bacterium]|nr:hypothetical protein [Prevotellaceae bacterium]
MKKVVKKNLLKGIMLMFIAIIPFVCRGQKSYDFGRDLFTISYPDKGQFNKVNKYFTNYKKGEDLQTAYFYINVCNNIEESTIISYKGSDNVRIFIIKYWDAINTEVINDDIVIIIRFYGHNCSTNIDGFIDMYMKEQCIRFNGNGEDWLW